MSKIHETTNDLVKQLMELGETKLALRVAITNFKTQLIYVEGLRLKREMAKFEARRTKQMAAVEAMAEEIPRIILSHQK